MATGVLMPKAGITVEECMITKWEKQVGDTVKLGDILFSYETDKAAFECESTAEGELLEIFFNDGDDVPVLVNVCAVGTKGEDVSSLRPGAAAEAPAANDTGASVAPSEQPQAQTEAPTAAAVSLCGDRLKISPRARHLADSLGLDASFAAPTGPDGRIIERDILTLSDSKTDAPAVASTASTATAPVSQGSTAEFEDVPFTKIRRVIASSMQNSLSSIPQLTHHHSFDATNILETRKCIKQSSERLGLPNITLNDIILFAVSRVLPKYPDFNAHVVDGSFVRRYSHVNLGIATDTPRGLMVPTLFNAEQKSLREICLEAKVLTKQAQEGSINPDLLQGGTFTVSNLGNLGVEMFTPVINAPQTAILGVCNLTTKFKMSGAQAVPYQAMGLSITYDHRVIDGAPEARFAQELIATLENFTAALI